MVLCISGCLALQTKKQIRLWERKCPQNEMLTTIGTSADNFHGGVES